MKRGLITTFTWNYRFGVNAILNGMDYHENDVHIHVLYTPEVPESYIKSACETFPLVEFHSLVEYMEKYPPPDLNVVGSRWVLEFYKYRVAQDLGQMGYDAVVTMDCDFLILGKFDLYFDIVAGTDLIMTSNCACKIPHAYDADPDAFLAREKDSDDMFIPLGCSPVFCDPRESFDFYEAVLSMAANHGADGTPLNKVIMRTRRLKDVYVLPSCFWCETIWGEYPIELVEVDGKRCYIQFGDKLMMSHRRYWVQHDTYDQAEAAQVSSERELIMDNLDLLVTECRVINTEWKLPLEVPSNFACRKSVKGASA